MANGKVFEDFFKNNEINKLQKNIGLNLNQEINNKDNNKNNNSTNSKFVLNRSQLSKIQDFVAGYVRDTTKSEMEIFKNPKDVNNKAKIQNYIMQGINKYREEKNLFIQSNDEKKIMDNVWDELIGFGPLEPLLKDPDITEIMVIDPNKTFIEKKGDKQLADIHFKDTAHIKKILDKIIMPIGRTIDEQSPTVDARLPQGFRLNAVIPPIALNDGVFITIRKFPSKVWTPADLISFKSAPKEVFDFLELCVKARKNICVSGGTGSGKTTLLNVLSNCIPRDDRIITIEDVAELKLVGDHICSEEARQPNAEGNGAVTIRDLVKNALRQRPDRIVVGECRGAEALDMLQAMNTGHDGSMTTGHANSPRDLMSRLEYMCLCSGDMPLSAIRPQISSALNIIVQIGRTRINGKNARRMLEIDEVITGFEDTKRQKEDYILRPIFDSNFKGDNKHEIAPTGYLPTFITELEEDYGFDRNELKKPEHYIEPRL